MNEEFKLSDKKIMACLNDSSQSKYREDDVKEFIKRLKEEITNVNSNTSLRGFTIQNKRFLEIIDKLAGDRLI